MKLKAPLATLVAAAVGLVILLGYVFPGFDALGMQEIRKYLLQWAFVLAAVALVVGVFNILAVHARKITEESGANPVYSAVLVISAVVTFMIVLGAGPLSTASIWIFNYLQVPVETSLMAILAISLSYATTRLLQRRANVFTILFTATAFLVLLGTGPLLSQLAPALEEPLTSLRDWIAQVPAAGGARGILLGVALGAIATGLRVLMGADRPYGG